MYGFIPVKTPVSDAAGPLSCSSCHRLETHKPHFALLIWCDLQNADTKQGPDRSPLKITGHWTQSHPCSVSPFLETPVDPPGSPSLTYGSTNPVATSPSCLTSPPSSTACYGRVTACPSLARAASSSSPSTQWAWPWRPSTSSPFS